MPYNRFWRYHRNNPFICVGIGSLRPFVRPFTLYLTFESIFAKIIAATPK